jgi:hypothetical protein
MSCLIFASQQLLTSWATVCATLGEFTEDNKDNFIKLNNNKDPFCNVTLQYTLAKEDRQLWDLMDQATYETIETMSNGKVSNIEYWDTTSQDWIKKRPAVSTIRIPGIVHECSTAYVGPENEGGSLDDFYRPHGVKNVVSDHIACF